MLGKSHSPRPSPITSPKIIRKATRKATSTPLAKKKKFGFLVGSSTDSDTEKSWNAPELDKAEKKRRKILKKRGVTAADIKLAHSSGSHQKVQMIKSIDDMSDKEEKEGEREIVRVRGMSVRRLDTKRSPNSRRRIRSDNVRKSIKSNWDTPQEWDMSPGQAKTESARKSIKSNWDSPPEWILKPSKTTVCQTPLPPDSSQAAELPPPLPPKNEVLRNSEPSNIPPLPPKSANKRGTNRQKTLKSLKSTWQAPPEWEVSSDEWDSSPSPEDWDTSLPTRIPPAKPPYTSAPAKPPYNSSQKPSLPPKSKHQPPTLPPKTGPGLPPKRSERLPTVNSPPPALPPKLVSREGRVGPPREDRGGPPREGRGGPPREGRGGPPRERNSGQPRLPPKSRTTDV